MLAVHKFEAAGPRSPTGCIPRGAVLVPRLIDHDRNTGRVRLCWSELVRQPLLLQVSVRPGGVSSAHARVLARGGISGSWPSTSPAVNDMGALDTAQPPA